MTGLPDNAEIVRTGSLLIAEYGELAPMGAVIRADHLSERGDPEGRATWLRIAQIAEDLLSEERPR
ncbi:MAG: hypothetical protein VW405_03350, partial [Rhodospirillaceae bacterium]